MKVRVLFFGMIAEAVESSVHEIENFNGRTIGELEDYLMKRYPQLSDFTFQIALNQNAVDKVAALQPVSEVALLPPFAGG